jgi:hypothetical protein
VVELRKRKESNTAASAIFPVPQGVPSAPVVQVLERRPARVAACVSVFSPERHTLNVSFNVFGRAVVLLDDVMFAKLRVLGRDKTIDVPLSGNQSQIISVLFWGWLSPKIDLRLNGTLISSI